MQRILLDDPNHVGGSTQLYLGATAGDGTGTDARTGGAMLKQWAADVNSMTTNLFPRINVKDYGALGDGVTDDSAAFSAAIAQINTSHAAGVDVVLYIPGGKFYINAPITQFAIHVPGSIVGDAIFKSTLLIGPGLTGVSYAGSVATYTTPTVFSWDEAWGGAPGSPRGGSIRDLDIVGVLTNPAQNALTFFDRNDFFLLQNVRIWNFNGSGISIGNKLNQNLAYMRESKFFNPSVWFCGSPTLPAVHITTGVASSGDSTNQLTWFGLDILSSNGRALVISGGNTAKATTALRFYGLRVEKAPTGYDLITIGDTVLTGKVNIVDIYGLVVNTVPSGAVGIRFSAPTLASAPGAIRIWGDVNTGTGGGIAIDAGSKIELHCPITSGGTDLSVGPSTLVAAPIYIDGNDGEQTWVTSIDPSSALFIRTPARRYGPPGASGSNAGLMWAASATTSPVRLTRAMVSRHHRSTGSPYRLIRFIRSR